MMKEITTRLKEVNGIISGYDGGMMPERPKGFPEGKQLMGPGGGLTIFHGTKDTLICGCYGQQPFLL